MASVSYHLQDAHVGWLPAWSVKGELGGLWGLGAAAETGEHQGLEKLCWNLGGLQRLGGVEVREMH